MSPSFAFPVAKPAAYAEAVGVTCLAALAAALVDRHFPVASLALIFMTAVVVVASRRGRGPAVLAALLGFALYDFFFVAPRHTFTITARAEVLTLLLFLVASLVTGNLAAQLRARGAEQAAIAARTRQLYEFGRDLAGVSGASAVIAVIEAHVSMILRRPARVLPPGGDGLAITAAGRPLGVLHLDPGPAPTPDLMAALMDQIALALERVRLSEDLAQSRLAAETERLRAALLASVSHDLRTPLVTIIGAAGSLAATPELAAPTRRDLAESIRAEGERLDRYVQNLLDMTRIEHGALKPKLVPTDIAEVLGAARRRLRAALAGFGFVVDLPESLPTVEADPVLLEQVLINLLDNAAKHAPAGSRLTIRGRAEGKRVICTICDEGPGIPPEARERIFDMFTRVTGGDRQPGGTGLGLPICRGMIAAMGGTIHAEAAPEGPGAALVFALPASPPELPC
ncbi:sensor histidine kinase [Rhodobacter capsulatus]|uniref:sensor histidine kinase n=1 Tax=Rhodobacter capsulatus TaxID=1061 RepID=UPI004027E88C